MIKNCASCWLLTKNHNTMHSQQNVKRYYSFRTNVIHICTLLSYSLKVFKNKTTAQIIYNNDS